MSTEDANPTISTSRRFSIRVPRPLWIGLAAVVVVVAGVGIRVGVPVYRQHMAIREIERLKGIVTTKKGGPEWLRGWVGDPRMTMLDHVTDVNLAMTEITDDGLRDDKGVRNHFDIGS
jgi:hypothetical protein